MILNTAAEHASTERPSQTDQATRLILGLLRCVLLLLRHEIHVIGFAGLNRAGHDWITVEVAPHPRLYHLYQGQCGWCKRRTEGHLTIYTWFAINDEGIRIQWEEPCANGLH